MKSVFKAPPPALMAAADRALVDVLKSAPHAIDSDLVWHLRNPDTLYKWRLTRAIKRARRAEANHGKVRGKVQGDVHGQARGKVHSEAHGEVRGEARGAVNQLALDARVRMAHKDYKTLVEAAAAAGSRSRR